MAEVVLANADDGDEADSNKLPNWLVEDLRKSYDPSLWQALGVSDKPVLDKINDACWSTLTGKSYAEIYREIHGTSPTITFPSIETIKMDSKQYQMTAEQHIRLKVAKALLSRQYPGEGRPDRRMDKLILDISEAIITGKVKDG